MNQRNAPTLRAKPLGARVILLGFGMFLLGGMCRSSVATLGILVMVVGAVIWVRQNSTDMPAPVRAEAAVQHRGGPSTGVGAQASSGNTTASFIAGAATGSVAGGWAIGGDLFGALLGGLWSGD